MHYPDFSVRPGETLLSFDAAEATDAGLVFIGHVRSPWHDRSNCPKNMRAARERSQPADIVIEPRFRGALSTLEPGGYVHILTWLHLSRRDLAQQMPRHAEKPSGTFSLRSPVRPNPIGMHLVKLVALDATTGILVVDAIDVLDGTPVLDIKPYFATVDTPPEA